MTKSLSTKEMSEILDKMWASTEDIKRLGCIGKNRALEVTNDRRQYGMSKKFSINGICN